MAMAAADLAAELQNLDPVPTEAEAVATLADAYAVFAGSAQAGVVTIASPIVASGKAAMIGALSGISVPGAGAAKLVAGVQAFWSIVAAGLATSFAGATAITPPPHAGLAAALATTFASNTSGAVDKDVATALIADDFYAQAIVGGTVTFPGPVVSPIL